MRFKLWSNLLRLEGKAVGEPTARPGRCSSLMSNIFFAVFFLLSVADKLLAASTRSFGRSLIGVYAAAAAGPTRALEGPRCLKAAQGPPLDAERGPLLTQQRGPSLPIAAAAGGSGAAAFLSFWGLPSPAGSRQPWGPLGLKMSEKRYKEQLMVSCLHPVAFCYY